MPQKTLSHSIITFELLESQLDQLRKVYAVNQPFPHIKLDNFLAVEDIEKIAQEFPSPRQPEWLHYKHVNENKLGLGNIELLPVFTKRLFEELLSERFTRFLSELTGIPDLLADRSLEGGGLHQVERGGYLNIHADFTVHHRIPSWKRRVNFLLYLNKDWDVQWNGSLELWDGKMTECVIKYPPFINQVVIFNTENDTFHGHPDPITCPEDVTRKSIALYYFTEDFNAGKVARSTNYQPRPTDGLIKKIFIRLDRMAVHLYSRSKKKLNISDATISRILKIFS